MTRTRKPNAKPSKRNPQVSDKTELSAAQLDAASGGEGSSTSLYQACTSGKHFPTATINP